MTKFIRNVIRGAGTVMVLQPEKHPPKLNRQFSSNTNKSDREAMRGDWEKVGADLIRSSRDIDG